MGPPGAGKGTQGARLAAYFEVPHIATGDMFRHAVEAGSPLGNKVKDIMERGELVPDDVTNEVLRERIRLDDALKGFILDGYPRNLDQARVLDETLDELGAKLDRVIKFMVRGDDIVKRLAWRRTCPVCKTPYHLITSPPRVDGVCDNDGAPLVQREDDTEETILRRLEVYGEQTRPLFELYAGRGLLVEVDAIGSTDEVFERLVEAVR